VEIGIDADAVNTRDLAYLGDAVFSLAVRTQLLQNGLRNIKELNATANRIVNAKAQSALVDVAEGGFTEQERVYYMRGRNTKGLKAPARTERMDYIKATGIEALFGYLYLTGQQERIDGLVAKAVDNETQ
jgi:ribonuclease-3 family protein